MENTTGMKNTELEYKPGGFPVYSQATDENRKLNRMQY
jgi:hypothetical protein